MSAKTAGKIAVKSMVCLLTGSNGQLGQLLRQRLASNGARVLAVDSRHSTPVRAEPDKRVSFITGDVTSQAFLDRLFESNATIDAVVNCAAAYRSYNYLTSYLVSNRALQSMRSNALNAFAIRGVIVNVIGLRDKYDDKYFAEQDVIAGQTGIAFDDRLDASVHSLAERLTEARIRCNSVVAPESADLALTAQLIHHILEDQFIAGQIVNMADEERPFLGSVRQILSEYHVPVEPVATQLPEPFVAPALQLAEPKATDWIKRIER